ncbi:AtpZ/AtpI family protein [Lacibacter sediminis]|uniref:AtpZ/AtpI family protein n=1 Tax=Lacibacter sediminis TaxID=2760713 RepID=A0A7G5XDR4_9BACT|nr:AtpZ/AtpI family protein [Lacibacter sediminis]QNA43617.1 AtpZ/AtpI family protein [Lacibacter sediminis]
MPQPTTNKQNRETKTNKQYLMQYASLATQLLVALGLAVFLGLKTDGWLQLNFPLLGWLLPLVVLMAMFYRILKDTSKKP